MAARGAAATVLLVGLCCTSKVTLAREAPAAGDSVVLRAASSRGGSLAPVERQMIEAVLLERAHQAGVVVCHDGAVSPGSSAAFAALCAGPGEEIAPFWWDLRIDLLEQPGHRMSSAALQLASSDGQPRSAPTILVLGPFLLTSGVGAGEARTEALHAVEAALRRSPEVLEWFHALADRPGMLRAHPLPPDIPTAGSNASADPGETAGSNTGETAAAGTPAEERAWNAEILRITDLLIDGKAKEAKERADALLRESRLPGDLAARTRELKEKAEARLASAATQPQRLDPPEQTPAPAPAAPGGAPGGQHSDRAFPVRLGVVGQGFRAGAEGQLRLTREGIDFGRAGKPAVEWSLSWSELASAARDDGLWESPFPILLVERSGRKRYLSMTDGHGHYVAGDPLLAAITEGQREFRQSSGGHPHRMQGDRL